MEHTLNKWVFYYRDGNGDRVVYHVGKYVFPKRTVHWRELENMEGIGVIGLEMDNGYVDFYDL